MKMGDARVVDRDMKLAESAHAFRDKLLRESLIRDVARNGNNLRPQFSDRGGSLLQFVFKNIGENKMGAFARKLLGGQPSKAASSAGDKDGRAFISLPGHNSPLLKPINFSVFNQFPIEAGLI
jgi:hypothetical protein